jgi:uncharacterized protein
MRKAGDSFELSASDLVGYLNCRHLSALERAVAEGNLKKPHVWDPLLKILWERGSIYEQNYVDHLTKAGLEVIRIDGFDVSPEAVAATIAAMRQGAQIIAQGAFSHQGWVGRADILRRIEVPSLLGAWSYEAIDTKLARETKAGAVLQRPLYRPHQGSSGLAGAHVCRGALVNFEPQQYRFADYAAISGTSNRSANLWPTGGRNFPSERALRNVRLAGDVRTAARDDDHLCLVAGISKLQINELQGRHLNDEGVGGDGAAAGLEARSWIRLLCPRAGASADSGRIPRGRRSSFRTAAGGTGLRSDPPAGTLRRRHLPGP